MFISSITKEMSLNSQHQNKNNHHPLNLFSSHQQKDLTHCLATIRITKRQYSFLRFYWMVAESLGTEGHTWSWCGGPSSGVLNFKGCPAQTGAVLLLRALQKPHSSQTLSRMSLCVSWEVSLLWIRALIFILFLKIDFFLQWQILIFLWRPISELWGSLDLFDILMLYKFYLMVRLVPIISHYQVSWISVTNNNLNSQTVPGLCLQQLSGLSNSSGKLRLSHLVLDLPAPPSAAVLTLEQEGCLDAGVLEKRSFSLIRVTMVGRHSEDIQSASLHLVLNKNLALEVQPELKWCICRAWIRNLWSQWLSSDVSLVVWASCDAKPWPLLPSASREEGVVFLGVNTLHMDTDSLDPLQFRLVSYHGAVGRVAFSSWDIHLLIESLGDALW